VHIHRRVKSSPKTPSVVQRLLLQIVVVIILAAFWHEMDLAVKGGGHRQTRPLKGRFAEVNPRMTVFRTA
jgi:hypothetical protein